MASTSHPSEEELPDANAILALSAALADRTDRVEELRLSLDRKNEEHDMLAGNLRSMQEQLALLRGVAEQRLAERCGGGGARAVSAGAQPPQPPQSLLPATVPISSSTTSSSSSSCRTDSSRTSSGSSSYLPASPHDATPPVAEEGQEAKVADAADDDEDDEDGPVYTWPDGSLHNVPPPPPASVVAPAGAAAAAAKKPSSLVPEALRQPLRALDDALTRVPAQIGRELDEALSRVPAAAVGEKLASFAKNLASSPASEFLERLRPSSRLR